MKAPCWPWWPIFLSLTEICIALRFLWLSKRIRAADGNLKVYRFKETQYDKERNKYKETNTSLEPKRRIITASHLYSPLNKKSPHTSRRNNTPMLLKLHLLYLCTIWQKNKKSHPENLYFLYVVQFGIPPI